MSHSNSIPLISLVEILLPCMKEDFLTVKKSYKIQIVTDEPLGKWPAQLGNSYFLESKWLLEDLIDMLVTKTQDIFRKVSKKNEIDVLEKFKNILT